MAFGIGFCESCRAGYTEDHREPPCIETDICGTTKEEPVYLAAGNVRAWVLYHRIANLSGADGRGLPTLNMIDFVFRYIDLKLTQFEFDLLLLKIEMIHRAMRERAAADIAEANRAR